MFSYHSQRKIKVGAKLRERILELYIPEDNNDILIRVGANKRISAPEFRFLCAKYEEAFIEYVSMKSFTIAHDLLTDPSLSMRVVIHFYKHYNGMKRDQILKRCYRHPNCPDEIKMLHDLSQ